MINISSELKSKLQQLNNDLMIEYPFDKLRRDKIRSGLLDSGSFKTIEKWSASQTEDWLNGGLFVGLDGSSNSTDGLPARKMHLFQVLAKSNAGHELWSADVHTQLLASSSVDKFSSSSSLATMELEMAIRVIDELKPRVLMLDGSVLHFYKENLELCEDLIELAIENEVLLIGVAEEIATNTLAPIVTPEMPTFSDADLLCGTLALGEAFCWTESSFAKAGLWRAAFRSAGSPNPIIVDGLLKQSALKEELLHFVFALTPGQGRGIPLWLDIIDQQVRITHVLLEGLLEQFVDPQLLRRLFTSKRSERVI